MALQMLPARGVAVLSDTRLKDLALRAAASTETLLDGLQGSAEEVFDCVTRDSDGEITRGRDGRAVLTMSAQRVQVPVGGSSPKPLRDVARRVRHLLGKVVATRPEGSSMLRLGRPVVLGNRPGGVPARIQSLHVHLKPRAGFGFVAIVPMEPDTSVLVALHSVVAVQSWQDMMVRYTTARASGVPGTAAEDQFASLRGLQRRGRVAVTSSSGSDGTSLDEEGSDAMSSDFEGGTEGGSDAGEEASEDEAVVRDGEGLDMPTPALDGRHAGSAAGVPGEEGSEAGAESGCYSSGEGEKGPVADGGGDSVDGSADEEVVASFASLFSKYEVVRLVMQPGQVVLLHGSAVHACDAARPGRWTPRMHVFVQEPAIRNATFPLECMDSHFALRFGRWARH